MVFVSVLKNWWRLTRAEHAFLTAFAVVMAEAIAAKSFTPAFLIPAIAPFFIVLASFALNDYLGFQSDEANKRFDRPLVSGAIKRVHALYSAMLFYVLGLASLILVNKTAFAIGFAFAVLSLFYDSYLKRVPLLGNAFIASSMSIAFVYGNAALADSLSNLNFFVLAFALMAFASGLGRELLITLRDVKGDRKAGMLTLPMLLGRRKTVIFASTLIYFAVAVSFLPLLVVFFIPYVVLVILADVFWLVVTKIMILEKDARVFKRVRNYSLYALGLGLLAFASLVFS